MSQLGACPDLATLQRLLLGQVSEADVEPLESHLAECQQCSQTIAGLPADDELVQSMRRCSPLLRSEPDEPADLIVRLKQLWTTTAAGVADLIAESDRETAGFDRATAGGPSDNIRTYEFLEPARSNREIGWFGRYCVLGILGRGGMGVVFLAEDQTRRNPALALLIAVIGLSLVSITAVSVWHGERMGMTLRQVEHERARADAGYRSARDTLNHILGRLERRRVGDAPQLKELQHELFEDSLAFYQGILANARDPDPAVRRDSAEAYERAGTIATLLGRWGDAAKHFEGCLKLMNGLPPDIRDAVESQVLLAACHNNIGLLANNNRQWSEAERQHQLALTIHDQLAKRQPENAAHRHGIAEAALNLGAVYQLTGRLAEAEPNLVRAQELLVGLLKEFPNDEGYRSTLAHVCENLALLRQNSGRAELAIQGHQAADDLLRPFVVRNPPGGEHALTLAAVCINLAQCLQANGQMETALAKANEAVDLTESILKQEPLHIVARMRAYNAHGVRAQLFDALQRHAEAVTDWDRVIELDTQPDPWLRQLFRALSLARSGQAVSAAAAADELATSPNNSADGLYDLACVYALSAHLGLENKQHSADDQGLFVERCAGQALSLLRKLQDQGYFKTDPRLDLLQTDSDLDALRDRDDFRELLKNAN